MRSSSDRSSRQKQPRVMALEPVVVVSMSSDMAAPPEHCPGTASLDAGKASACEGCPNQQICATAPKAPDPDIQLIHKRMSSIKKKVVQQSAAARE
jgi:hypothetical protein